MPAYNNPRQAIIVPRGGTDLEPLVLTALAAAALAGLVMFIAAHLVLISACALALPAATYAVVRFMHRYTMVVHEPAPVRTVQASVPRAAIVHNHIHFHGLSADDAAALSQALNVPALPAPAPVERQQA